LKTLFQHFDNITFGELFPSKEIFLDEFKQIGFPQQTSDTEKVYLSDETINLVWLLLIGRFADSTISPYNTQGAFKVRLMSRVWQYAPAWKKELDIQNKLRTMSLEGDSELYDGSKAIYNTALNPSTQPGTQTSEELNYINSQNVTKYKKSKIEGLSLLTELLKNDVTEAFLRRFDDLFITIIYTGRDLAYETYEGDN
jgi:hypothetical protein